MTKTWLFSLILILLAMELDTITASAATTMVTPITDSRYFYAPPVGGLALLGQYSFASYQSTDLGDDGNLEVVYQNKEEYGVVAFYSFAERLSAHVKFVNSNVIRDRRSTFEERFTGPQDLELGFQAFTPIAGIHLVYGVDSTASMGTTQDATIVQSGNNYTGLVTITPFLGTEFHVGPDVMGARISSQQIVSGDDYFRPDGPVYSISPFYLEVFDEIRLSRQFVTQFSFGAGYDREQISDLVVDYQRSLMRGLWNINVQTQAQIAIAARMVKSSTPFTETQANVGLAYEF
jgi:hypothetical protein